ncbi:MAG: tRNA (uridine(34)/cytosine(34)/5-carboxymethylaminomethyluridine(34)-2'-O)-methyltransferase TrmL [Gammaproteobacteria bacterium CG11_big_fil_rev_8_21_14_0_20_46_22]|nr:MAG: tRNA (uridine(34)/cytosine(34)/5-carboxymethylaminomethyluridine(34)-2'-O)-methyltransferase TrmL [Gammaproteobacteria bacterium CG12_big_fil_rev_8_21_14_0_65_46_12]PIR10431.1 MAG: tRNA (uridine(34)/cytosine(34)/5-carboxymethylaminomethyluridine(34)-2'-O)-methyltransferase TrmL [Gammaproteobacteria bacterium CG11_big_fil_rev_8_21_14_0_20_46_22]
MFNIALVQPEIPPNTGNIIRLCANSGANLHIIHPAAFEFSDKQLRRAGLDYHEFARVQHHDNLDAFLKKPPGRLFTVETNGDTVYSEVHFQESDTFIFGSEGPGLSDEMIAAIQPTANLRIPMQSCTRSLNLSNCAALVLYEAWRQLEFCGS